MFSQGYIGITGQTVIKRFSQHKKDARRSKARKKSEFKKALLNNSELVVETLVISDYSYTKNLERLLRPTSNIGWNKTVGGASVAESLQYCRDAQITAIKKYYAEMGHPFQFQKPWRFYQARRKKHIWSKASEIITMIKDGIGDSYISKSFGEKSRSTTVRTIRELYLEHGWDPLSDEEYLKDYPEAGIKNGNC